MRRIVSLAAALAAFSACSSSDTDVANASKSPQAVCLASLEAGKGQIAVNDCTAACRADHTDKISCGGQALGHLQSVLEEIGTYVGLLKPSQSPKEMAFAVETELRARYGAQIDLRVAVNQFLGGIIRDLRGMREGAYYAVGGTSETRIPLAELPLDPRLLSFVYGRAESLTVKGEWTDKELALLGSVANGGLAIIDLLLAQDWNVQIDDVPEMNGIVEVIAVAAGILNDNEDLLVVDDPDSVALARDETHAMMSLLAGRETDRENVAQATAGVLGAIKAEYGRPAPANPPVIQFTDVDGDGTLSRGDNIVFVLGINGEDVVFGTIYPLSAKLTESIFAFLGDANANLDGNKVPVRIAPLYNSLVRELGIFATAFEAAGVNLDTMPDAVALDFQTFFSEFEGIRRLLPHWYYDPTTGANKTYFDDATLATNPSRIYLAFEQEGEADTAHFTYANDVTWYENLVAPGGPAAAFAADGLKPNKGYYVLWQDPTFAGLLNVNTAPFIGNGYTMSSDLSTGDEFVAPADNRMTNAVMNAFIVWWAK